MDISQELELLLKLKYATIKPITKIKSIPNKITFPLIFFIKHTPSYINYTIN